MAFVRGLPKTHTCIVWVHLANNGGKISATGDIVVNRSLYNVRFGSGSFFDNLGDKTIYDEFMLKVSLVTK